MESTLETVALFALKLAHDTDDASPVLRDDPIMAAYEREVFGLLVRNGDIEAIQLKMGECVAVAATERGHDKMLGEIRLVAHRPLHGVIGLEVLAVGRVRLPVGLGQRFAGHGGGGIRLKREALISTSSRCTDHGTRQQPTAQNPFHSVSP